jgi:hypothetical protein
MYFAQNMYFAKCLCLGQPWMASLIVHFFANERNIYQPTNQWECQDPKMEVLYHMFGHI